MLDTRVDDSIWSQSVDASVPAGTTLHLGTSAPTEDRWDLAAVEVIPAPG
jgi:hypothetical protein